MRRKMQLQNSCMEWKAVPYFMLIQPKMALCFMFLSSDYPYGYPSDTSCFTRVMPMRASGATSSLPGAGKKDQVCSSVGLKLRST